MPHDTETLSLRDVRRASRRPLHDGLPLRADRHAPRRQAGHRVAGRGRRSRVVQQPGGPPRPPGASANWSDRLKARMIAGDERGSWLVVEACHGLGSRTRSGSTWRCSAPALRDIGEAWHRGEATVAEEHRASAVAHRLIGRLGARFAARGRPRGTVVLGAPPGERHRLPMAMVADILRAAGFEVIDLGSDVPGGVVRRGGARHRPDRSGRQRHRHRLPCARPPRWPGPSRPRRTPRSSSAGSPSRMPPTPPDWAATATPPTARPRSPGSPT